MIGREISEPDIFKVGNVLEVPSSDMLEQYEISRCRWSEYMKTKATFRDKETGEILQLTNDSNVDFNRFEYIFKGHTTYRDREGNFVFLPIDHPDIKSGLVVHGNSGLTTIINRETGEKVRVESGSEFDRTKFYHPSSEREVSWKPNEGKTAIVVVDTGEYLWVSKTHHDLVNNIQSGLWKYPFKGRVTVYDPRNPSKKHISVTVDDPRFLSGDLIPTSKGKTTVYTKDGTRIQVDKDDPRVKDGTYTHINKSRIRAIDNDGKEYRVLPNDNRLMSGELRPKDLLKGKSKPRYVDPVTGKEYRATENHPKVLSGEWVRKAKKIK